MRRILFFALILAAAAFINPTLRAQALPYVQPVLDPVYEWLTRGRIRDIAKNLQAQAETGRPLPTRETLDAFLAERYSSKDAARDSWGTPYYLQESWDQVKVGSAGRDGEVGTADDIVSSPVRRGN